MKTGTYKDPFANSLKEAKLSQKTAKIKPHTPKTTASASTATSNAVKTTASATTSPSAKTMTESTKKECSSKPIKITRKELVSIVKNCVEKVIQQRRKAALKPIRRDGYDDNPVVGWNFEEDFEREHGSGDHEIEASRKLYGKYGRECAQMGKRPDAWGFDIWRRNRAWESLKPLEKRP